MSWNTRPEAHEAFKQGRTLFEQAKYNEAELLFRQAVHAVEKTLGCDDEHIIYYKFWLSQSLSKQGIWYEAEQGYRPLVGYYEEKYGSNSQHAFQCKVGVGLALYYQGKYRDAEEMLRQAIGGYEKSLDGNSNDALEGKYGLGMALYEQEKYNDAELILRQVAEGEEMRCGSNGTRTIKSKHYLGIALYEQKKYNDAQIMLRQAVEGEETKYGASSKQTLDGKYFLAMALYAKDRYNDAEIIFRQVVKGQEARGGSNWGRLIDSKVSLGGVLYKQKKYEGSLEMLQQVLDAQEKKLGSDHERTRNTSRTLRELQSKVSVQNASLGRLATFFDKAKDSTETYTDSDISAITTLLKEANPRWSKVPRTYVVLRRIGHLDLLDQLLDIGFSDYFFPVTERNMPQCLRPSVRSTFLDAQKLVLTKSVGLERGGQGQHSHFKQGEPIPFKSKEVLGSGGFGQVDKVMSLVSFREYARKRVLRSSAFRGRRLEDMKQFITEIQILKRLEHRHIVDFIGSYTDPKYINLIMSPVAEMDLSVYLRSANKANFCELRTFFGCLATALAFLHEKKVRHKDIKPSNILVNRGAVLLTDFGLSLDFTDGGSTTASMVNGLTARYCAPEVAQYLPRNTASDIWSLGVVFIEMIVVLKGRTPESIDEFFSQHGSHQLFIRVNPEALPQFIAQLEAGGDLFDNRALLWTRAMLSMEQRLRPTAASLVASIIAPGQAGGLSRFCGICCVSEDEESLDEDFSDFEMSKLSLGT